MVNNWSIASFAHYMNSLLKRYFAEENLISSGAVELRAAWRTAQYVYCCDRLFGSSVVTIRCKVSAPRAR